MRKNLFFLMGILTILLSCKKEVISDCFLDEGRVVYDPICWGIIVQVRNRSVNAEKFRYQGVDYDNVIQVMGYESAVFKADRNLIDSLYSSSRYLNRSFYFYFRDATNQDLDTLEKPCTANNIWYSLNKKVIITVLTENCGR